MSVVRFIFIDVSNNTVHSKLMYDLDTNVAP